MQAYHAVYLEKEDRTLLDQKTAGNSNHDAALSWITFIIVHTISSPTNASAFYVMLYFLCVSNTESEEDIPLNIYSNYKKILCLETTKTNYFPALTTYSTSSNKPQN